MKLEVIDEKKYMNFALKNKYISIYQVSGWGDLKAINGWKKHLIGVYQNDKLVGVTLLLQKQIPFNRSIFYSPRGFLMDMSDEKLMRQFNILLKKYLKKERAIFLKVDPNVIYSIYDKNKQNRVFVEPKVLDIFKKNKYKHLGFTENFETTQPRFLCRIKLADTYEKTLASYSKTTIKNIEKVNECGIYTREIKDDEMEEFMDLFRETGDNKHFAVRPTKYYQKMKDLMGEYLKFYITVLEPKKYIDRMNIKLVNLQNDLQELESLMKKINVGKKMTDKKESLLKKINEVEKDINYVKEIGKEKDMVYLGALLSVFVGNESVTFISGTTRKYHNFSPKYSFYDQHIKDSIKLKKEYCNFYGISGNIDEKSEYYNIYEIKKGFNPEIVELVGEFDLIISKLYYFLYKYGYKLYRKIRH